MLIPTLVILFASLATPQPQAVNTPDTPAGHTLKAWLDAFNSGDRATEEKYLKTYDPERSLDDEMRFRGRPAASSSRKFLRTSRNGSSSWSRSATATPSPSARWRSNPASPPKWPVSACVPFGPGPKPTT